LGNTVLVRDRMFRSKISFEKTFVWASAKFPDYDAMPRQLKTQK